jgi:hypothetical protein
MFTLAADTSTFLDRFVIESEAERIEFANLKRNAFYLRRVARNSIRKRKSPSSGGQPPRSVRGDLKRGIWAVMDGRGTAVVGPVKWPWGTGAPNTLEFGGDSVIDNSVRREVGDGGEMRMVRTGGREVRPGVRVVYGKIRTQAQADRATRINREIFGPRTIRVAERPFMGPALDKSIPKLAPMWAMSVRGGGSDV